MIYELISFGIAAGFVAGLFGLGGGTILVPILLFAGFDMKQSVSISIMQMVFSSFFGTFLNLRKKLIDYKDGIVLGLGGFSGGVLNSFVLENVSSKALQLLFMSVLLFAIIRVVLSSTKENEQIKKDTNFVLLFIIGFFVGLIAMSIGVGGSIMLVPILVGFFGYNLKVAASLSLFFVIFSSSAGFISLWISQQMLFFEGTIVGLSSLLGVFLGTKAKLAMNIKYYKQATLVMYLIIFSFMLYKTLSI